jgi:hypothetical protein
MYFLLSGNVYSTAAIRPVRARTQNCCMWPLLFSLQLASHTARRHVAHAAPAVPAPTAPALPLPLPPTSTATSTTVRYTPPVVSDLALNSVLCTSANARAAHWPSLADPSLARSRWRSGVFSRCTPGGAGGCGCASRVCASMRTA